jgi:proline iminopeptidase
MATIYPEIEPRDQIALKVSDIHTLHVEECGNPKGVPVIYLHGGPGGTINPFYRRLFNPDIYRIISYDQRGCGKSTPRAELKENTTWHLVEDLDKIRDHFKIDRAVIAGGSWGSTLALAYGLTFPERCLSLILRGIFLGTKPEINWLYQDGANRFFPDAWQDFIKPIPLGDQANMVEGYWKKLNDQSKQVREDAAIAWSVCEAVLSQLIPDSTAKARFSDPVFAEVFAKIECHFFRNNVFFNDKNFILSNLKKLKHTPGYIVHGRYDMVCVAEHAWKLHQAWPSSRLHLVPNAGHAVSEPGIAEKLVEVSDFVGKLMVEKLKL